MKNLNIMWVIVMACILSITPLLGQSKAKKNNIIADSNLAKAEFIEKDALMKGLFEKAYGYVIFPNVGKGGFGIGGAAGASANVQYTDGVMVFTMLKGGLMYEAAVGGQKFKFDRL